MNSALFQKVRDLRLPFGEYALFGSAPMGVRELKECEDIDILVSPPLFAELRNRPGWTVKHSPSRSEALEWNGMEFFQDWYPGVWDTQQLIQEAEILEGLPFVKLEHVLRWKELFGRGKDLGDIEIIRRFLGSWKIFIRSEETWTAMLLDIQNAQKTIDMESYIFAVQGVGNLFLELFKKKAKEGVRVRLLCDMVGSYGFFNSPEAKALELAGVEVRFFNPIRPWRIGTLTSLFHRDHRKLLIIDSRIGYTGGLNISSRMSGWRDTHVRVEGVVLKEMTYAFERMWVAAYEKTLLRKFRKPNIMGAAFAFLTGAPHLRQRFVYRNMLRAVRKARQYAYFTTPYFVPSLHFFGILMRAAKRGVDVRILLPENSDVRTVDIASGTYLSLALRSGIKIYRYRHSILHVKSAVIDDEWGTVGSANLDNLSLFSNYEGNLVSSDKRFIEELKGHFMADLKDSYSITYESWARRPFLQKCLEILLWPFHRIL